MQLSSRSLNDCVAFILTSWVFFLCANIRYFHYNNWRQLTFKHRHKTTTQNTTHTMATSWLKAVFGLLQISCWLHITVTAQGNGNSIWSKLYWLKPKQRLGWSEPHFLDAGTDRIKLDILSGNRYGVQMEEEIPYDPPYKLVTINYAGKSTNSYSNWEKGIYVG